MPAGTGQSEPDVTEIRELEERLDNFRIQTDNDLTIRGNAWQGYALNVPNCPAVETAAPANTGACCAEDGSCTITTEAECGGTYQGDGTVCDPNPCPQPTGACCVGASCTIETESDCTDLGGTYQGDDTTCDPNPCCGDNFVTLCKCGFDEFEPFVSTPPKKYLTATTFNQCNTDPVQQCTATATWDTDTCIAPGTGTCTDITGFGCGGTCFPSLCPFTPCSLLVPGTSATHVECGGSLPAFETYRTIDLSDEYTTAQLITNAEALFSDTYGDCPEGCVLDHTLDEDELCVTVFCVPS